MSEHNTNGWDNTIARVQTKRPLTARERAVAALLADGKRPAEVADALGISLWTVRHYIVDLANIIPSDLAAASRIAVWARGATQAVLTPPRVPSAAVD